MNREKFQQFDQMCEDAKTKGIDEVWVASPHSLGDTYDELIDNLKRLGKANLALRVWWTETEEVTQ